MDKVVAHAYDGGPRNIGIGRYDFSGDMVRRLADDFNASDNIALLVFVGKEFLFCYAFDGSANACNGLNDVIQPLGVLDGIELGHTGNKSFFTA